MKNCDTCYRLVQRGVSWAFAWYGQLVGRHPLPFIILPIVTFGGMGCGLLVLDVETDLETVYFPMNSRAIQNRQYVRDTFPNLNNQSYNAFSQSDSDRAVDLLFKTRDGLSVLNSSVTAEIAAIVSRVKALSSSGKNYSDLCAMSSSQCLVDRELALSSGFQSAVAAGSVTYPTWNNVDLETSISGQTVTGGILVSATVLKVSFKLAEEDAAWQSEFLTYAQSLNPTLTEVSYATSESLNEEVDKSTKGDIVFFSLTTTLCCTYASMVTSGGNPVSTRSMLSIGGILAAGLGIVGSMGLLSACGVKFVNIVGVIHFLIIGIGVDDMFLIMSAWSENLPKDPREQTIGNVPNILSKALASAGIGITITSLTDLLAFAIGTASVFLSVISFSLYAGVAVLFCYLTNITFFSACVAFHGRRVYSSRHCVTCRVTKPREALLSEGKSSCFACLCGGSPPRQEKDDESLCEKFPSRILPHLFTNRKVSVATIFLFFGYLAAAIFDATQLRQGLVLQDLVLDSSYCYQYLTLSDEYFPIRIPLGFVVDQQLDYSGNDGTLFLNLLQQVRNDTAVNDSFVRCWLSSYQSSVYYNSAAPQNFMANLQMFLTNNADFKADVVLDGSKTSVVASRCFVMSEPNSDQYSNAGLMERMRELADGSSLPVFAYHSSFVAYEQYLAVLPATLLLVGCAVAVMMVVTIIFLPHVLMVLLVVVTIVMILVGIFGFMHFWGLTLSYITMIHLVMSVGFSVDFSAHVCSAYLLSNALTRQERARDAIRHSGGPILNGATSTLLGILLLLASTSFIFQSFFKVMFLVILFGLLHAVFFLPAVLSLLGPVNRMDVNTGSATR